MLNLAINDRESFSSVGRVKNSLMQKVAEEKGLQIVKVKISYIKFGNRLRKKVRNIPRLAKSIANEGLHDD